MKVKNIHAQHLGRLGGLAASRRKLTSEQVLAIRESKETYKILAERYGVSEVTVCSIRNGRTWKWLSGCTPGDENQTQG